MCGIIGITGNNLDEFNDGAINSMLLALSKRGPDDKGVEKFNNCILGQTRLSIIDLSQGHQPMKDNKKNISITFNGEIYNYQELKKELESKGHIFSTHSDTEVILKTYIEHGTDCPKYLDGMFAFAIWDEDEQTLFMARDRFGKKPLYYTFDKDNNLIFASEMKAIFESGLIKGKIDTKALDNYLTLMYIPPWKTVYSNINTLPPASIAVYKEGKMRIEKYWELKYKPILISYEEAKKEIKRLLDESIKKRMIADVEIGSLLSGGVDSTLVTNIAQKYSKSPIKTFSVGYQDYINELPFALEASKKIGSEHYSLQVEDNMVSELYKIIEYFDEPHADSSDFPQYLVSKLASSKVKVALSGDGADELFLGYGWYTKHKNLSYRKHFFEKVFLSPFAGHIKNIQIFTQKEKRALWKNNSCVNNDYVSDQVIKTKISSEQKINLFDLTTYLPGQLLTKSDRAGMINSLEIRSPFLDHHLVEFVYNLPQEFKLFKNKHKIILKDILSEIMPEEFVNRRKQGFGAPVKDWLRNTDFKSDVLAKLNNSSALIYNYFNPFFVEKILDDFYKKNDDKYNYKIWLIYSLEIWLKSHEKYHEKQQ